MKYLNAANDCCIATINYHMPTFDDEIENPDESNKCESSSSNNTIDKNTENENNEQILLSLSLKVISFLYSCISDIFFAIAIMEA